jgi:quercetin dioxygenase-like cupin family protein
VLGGRLRFTLDGVTRDLGAGDEVFIAREAVHQWQVLEDRPRMAARP